MRFHSIRLRFALLFICLLLISCMMVGFYVYVRNVGYVLADMEERMVETATNLLQLSEVTDLSIEEAQRFLDDGSLDMTRYTDFAQLPMRIREQGHPDSAPGQLLRAHHAFTKIPMLAIHLEDGWLLIEPNINKNAYVTVRNQLATSLLLCLATGSALFLVAIRYITSPIQSLTRATKQVAEGNFDIALPVKSRDELGQLTAHFNTMVAELRNNELLRKDFVSNVSHEFKTPISAIRGYAQLLQDSQLPAPNAEYVQQILDASSRLSHITENILRLSRLEHQDIAPKATTFALDEQIRQAILAEEPAWSAKELEWDIDLASVQYTGEQELIAQIWANLLGNAIKFTPPGGRITVHLANAERPIVTIADTGFGIEPEALPHIFEQFYQADPSRAQAGNGLGLAIVKRVVELCGGEVSVSSAPGQGSTFIVKL